MGPKPRIAGRIVVVGFPAVSHRNTPGRSRPLPRCLLTATLLAGVSGGCNDPNTGIDAPVDNLFFPEGLLLDPRTPQGEAARYLFVSNGNNDLNFNGGSVTAIDLEAFFGRWSDTAPDAEGNERFTYAPYPFCEGAGERCVLDVGAHTTDDFPCRRLGLLPQVVECDEGPFVVDGVRLGDFSTHIAASNEPNGTPRLWIPVRGDPSVTFVDIEGAYPGPPDLDCGQREVDGESHDESRCADDHRLTHLRNDRTLDEIPREPFNVHISEAEGYRYGFVAHSSGPALSVIDLDGLSGDDSGPAIVDINNVFSPTVGAVLSGGFGLATRPCGACGVEGEDEIPGFNQPDVTLGCTRPLVYSSLRFQLLATSFTASGIDPEDLPSGAIERDGCEDDQGNYLGPFCATPEQVGDECAILCEPRVRNVVRFPVGGVDPLSTVTGEALGDVHFADACGDELYVLQTSPGALLRVDTSLDSGEPLDIPAGRPIEVCDQPSRFQVWEEEGLAFVACFQAAYVYVVDLRAEQVTGTVITGTGPHDLVVDEARGMLYVANLLEGSISVIDVGVDRPTRFTEVARIGLQEPFSR